MEASKGKTDEEIEAKADGVSAPKEDEDAADKVPYIVGLSKAYNWEGKSVSEIDLARLREMTTLDAQSVDKVMAAMNYHPQNKFRDTLYTKHIAMRATGYPVEFFNQLRWKDMHRISARITLYFLYS